jgi:hypothetical protein
MLMAAARDRELQRANMGMRWLKREWWKAMIAVGVLMVIGSLAGAYDIGIVGLGIIALGFGEWMNHRLKKEFRHGRTFEIYERFNRPLGVRLLGLGTGLVGLGLFLLLTSRVLFSS